MLPRESVEEGGDGIPDGFRSVKTEWFEGVSSLVAKTERAKWKVAGIGEMLRERRYGRTPELKQGVESRLLLLERLRGSRAFDETTDFRRQRRE